MNEKKYYSTGEVVTALDGLISQGHLILLCHQGKIKAVRRNEKGAHFKIPADELERLKKEYGV